MVSSPIHTAGPAAPAHALVHRCAVALEHAVVDSVIVSTTAARLHGLWLPNVPDEVHLACASPGRRGREMTRSRRRGVIAHRFQLGPDQRTIVSGLPVTSLARTWFDLARVLAVPDLIAAGDSALRAGATTDELQSVASRSPRMPTSLRARLVLPLLDARSRSRPESHLRVAVTGLTVEAFAVNEPVFRDQGGWLAEPDLSLPGARLALEYQGADHAEIGRMRRDLTRFADMRQNGWVVLPYGPAEVFGRPWEVRGEVRTVLSERAPHLLRPHSPARLDLTA